MDEEAALRERLLSTAIDVFSLKGYAAANLTDITNALNVSRGPIYYHFKDKYGLFKATFDAWESSIRTSHGKIIAQTGVPILTILGQTIYNCLGLCRKFKPNYFVGLETIGDLDELKLRYHALVSDIYQAKILAVEAAMERGELGRALSPKIIVDTVYILYDGVRVGLERSTDPLDPAEVEPLVELELSVLGAKASGRVG